MSDNLPLEALSLAQIAEATESVATGNRTYPASDVVLTRARAYLAFLTQSGDEGGLLQKEIDKANAGAALPSITAPLEHFAPEKKPIG